MPGTDGETSPLSRKEKNMNGIGKNEYEAVFVDEKGVETIIDMRCYGLATVSASIDGLLRLTFLPYESYAFASPGRVVVIVNETQWPRIRETIDKAAAAAASLGRSGPWTR